MPSVQTFLLLSGHPGVHDFLHVRSWLNVCAGTVYFVQMGPDLGPVRGTSFVLLLVLLLLKPSMSEASDCYVKWTCLGLSVNSDS